MIERFLQTGALHKTPVEVAHQFDGVAHLSVGMVTKQFTDGHIGRTPERAPRMTGEILVHEERGSFVGEDDRCAREVRSVFVEDILCYIFQE